MITLVMHNSGEFPYYPEHWADVRSAFDISFVYKIGGEQTKGFVHIESVQELPEGRICLIVSPAEANSEGLNPIELRDYDHPENVVYVFGPDDDKRGWHKKWGTSTDCVTIRTPSSTELYASHVAAMVLYDRLSKGDQRWL